MVKWQAIPEREVREIIREHRVRMSESEKKPADLRKIVGRCPLNCGGKVIETTTFKWRRDSSGKIPGQFVGYGCKSSIACNTCFVLFLKDPRGLHPMRGSKKR